MEKRKWRKLRPSRRPWSRHKDQGGTKKDLWAGGGGGVVLDRDPSHSRANSTNLDGWRSQQALKIPNLNLRTI